jgi:uncharacterized membrane protein YphA (DoxX/SURF4 family)
MYLEIKDKYGEQRSGRKYMTTWMKIKPIAYWIATLMLVSETAVGAFWDILKVPSSRDVIIHLGYPEYMLLILGIWKLLAVIVLLIPRFPLFKEWAYAGIFFEFSGAIASHIAKGDGFSAWSVAAIFVLIEIISWVLRPASRKLVRQQT